MRTKRTMLVAAVASIALAVPASAITNGGPDDEVGDGVYDAVGQLLFHVPEARDPRFEDAGSWFTCSGTLVSGSVVVTAGHCTYAIGVDGSTPNAGADPADKPDAPNNWEGGNDVWISFAQDSDFDILEPSSSFADAGGAGGDGNAARYEQWSGALDASPSWNRATAYSHPSYLDAAFFLFDLGVLQLDVPVEEPSSGFASLPAEGYLDALQNARRTDPEVYFTPVGFGIQEIVPRFQSDDERYEATARLVTTKGTHGIDGILPGTSVVFTNNAGQQATGGTCFGDSGGPYFVEDTMVIGAVTSYGVSPNCTGTGGGYRIDKAADLGFIAGFPRAEDVVVEEETPVDAVDAATSRGRGSGITRPNDTDTKGQGSGKPADRPSTAAAPVRGRSVR